MSTKKGLSKRDQVAGRSVEDGSGRRMSCAGSCSRIRVVLRGGGSRRIVESWGETGKEIRGNNVKGMFVRCQRLGVLIIPGEKWVLKVQNPWSRLARRSSV